MVSKKTLSLVICTFATYYACCAQKNNISKNNSVFNISNDTPFQKADLEDLKTDPEKVILQYFPLAGDIYKKKEWTFPTSIDRVYAIDKAKRILNYRPSITRKEDSMYVQGQLL